VSAASTSAALIMLLGHRARFTMPALADLHRMDSLMVALELILVIALVVSLGPVARAWMNAWGLFLVLTVVLGNIIPLLLLWRAPRLRNPIATAAILVLLGGFLLRFVIVFSAESVGV